MGDSVGSALYGRLRRIHIGFFGFQRGSARLEYFVGHVTVIVMQFVKPLIVLACDIEAGLGFLQLRLHADIRVTRIGQVLHQQHRRIDLLL